MASGHSPEAEHLGGTPGLRAVLEVHWPHGVGLLDSGRSHGVGGMGGPKSHMISHDGSLVSNIKSNNLTNLISRKLNMNY